MLNKIVALRNKIKAKKPVFKRHDAHKKVRADGGSWRRPKGIQNKMRLHRKGYAKGRSTGYGSPKEAYGLSRSGLTQHVVYTVADFSSLDPKTDGVIIARMVGNRRRLVLIEHAQKHQFTVLNLDVNVVTDKIHAALEEKASRKKQIVKKRDEKEKALAKKKASAKKSEENKDKSQDVSPEEKKLEEKKEHDKVLTKEK